MKILVIRNIHEIPEDSKNVTFITNLYDEYLLATKYYKQVNLIYTDDILYELEKMEKEYMKFNNILGNPPYGKQECTHQKITCIIPSLLNQNGKAVLLFISQMQYIAFGVSQ